MTDVTPPRLTNFSWRVDVKTASNFMDQMSATACILNLQVDSGQDTGAQNVTVELSKESLDTMLDGLSKIQHQLASLTQR